MPIRKAPLCLSVSRRQALLSSAAFALYANFGRGFGATANPLPDRPNILFIMADDLGYADVSCYGRREYSTPSVDGLAREGTRFTQAYANSAVCSATRTALMTGRYQNRLPIGLEEPLAGRDVGLPPSHPTLPSLLRNAGYATHLVGKWHLGALPKYGPLLSGYDHFWGFRGGSVDYFTHASIAGPDLWDDRQPVEQTGYMTDLLGKRAREIIETSAAPAKPFFISLHFSAPHFPWEGPDDEGEAERLAARKDPMAIMHYDGGSLETYAEMVVSMDRQIGHILDLLDRQGLADNTIVVFTSDNGGERFSDTWPFTGKKTELLEGGLRIPAIIRWPGKIAPAKVSDQVMITMDWVPTLLAAAAVPAHPGYPPDGVNLLPLLSANEGISRTLCWRYLNLNQQACRSGDWKYLKILDNEFLFNVVDDPLERANLKEREPEIFADLIAKYHAWDAAMLPLDSDSFTHGFTGRELADHFGVSDNRTLGTPPSNRYFPRR